VGDQDVLERVVARLREADPGLGDPSGWPPPGADAAADAVADADADTSTRPVPVIWLHDAARARLSGRGEPTLPVPPPWAMQSVVEDGGVTHERVSHLHPLVLARIHGNGILATAVTDVSVSVVDRPRGRGWARQSPRIQVEGGSYPVAEAQLLVQAITALIGQVGGPHPSA